MNKTNFILAGLAIAQAVILFFFMGNGSSADFEQEVVAQGTRPLSQLFEEQMGSIVIRESGQDSVKLAHQDSGWVLADRGNYPVKPETTKDFAKALRKLYLVRPLSVGTERFYDLEISDERYSRHVTVKSKSGETLADFYLGEAGSMDRLFYRDAGSDKVFTASGLATWDLDSSVTNWIEAPKVAFETKDVRSIQRAGPDEEALKLTGVEVEDSESELKWTAADGLELDQKKVNAWLTALSSISLKEPLGKEAKDAPGLDTPSLTLTIAFKDAATPPVIMTLGAERADQYDWVFKSSNQPYFGTIRDYVRDDVLSKSLRDLKPDASKEPSPPK